MVTYKRQPAALLNVEQGGISHGLSGSMTASLGFAQNSGKPGGLVATWGAPSFFRCRRIPNMAVSGLTSCALV